MQKEGLNLDLCISFFLSLSLLQVAQQIPFKHLVDSLDQFNVTNCTHTQVLKNL